MSVFKPMKTVWKGVLEEYFKTHGHRSVDKPTFTKLYKKTVEGGGYSQINAKSGFLKCGIYPFDPSRIDHSKVQPFLKFLKYLARNHLKQSICQQLMFH